MTDRSKFEAMLEALINEDQETAKELFHNIVVAKSREIYEELLESDFGAEEKKDDEPTDDAGDEGDSDEGDVGGDATDDFASDVESDGEDEGESEDSGEDEDVEDRVQDLEDALEDLKAEFEQLLAGEQGEEHMGGDDMGGEEEPMDMGGEEPADMGMEPEQEDESMGGKTIHHIHHNANDGMMETVDADEQLIREYVEKVGMDWDSSATSKEGGHVGAQSGSVTGATNTKSTLDGSIKNDMGGTTSNIAQNGNANTTTFANQGQLKGNAVLKGTVVPNPDAKGNINVPGGKAGKTGFKTPVAGGHGTEKKGERPGKMAGAGTGEMGGQRGEQFARSPLNARK
jgi:hypothetical protein